MYDAPDLPADDARCEGEFDTLVRMLDYYRAVLLRKGAGLNTAQLATRVGPSEMTIGGLVKHMALVEQNWFRRRVLDEAPTEPWASVDWTAEPDWDFHSAVHDSPAELRHLFDEAVAASRNALTVHHDLEYVITEVPGRPRANLRWVLVHMIEEYARHCGHADLLRESIDGQTGD